MKDYFQNRKEFACPCCKQVVMKDLTYQRFNLTRSIAGIPMVVNSGYRCEKHNKAVGGSANSAHLRGAGDIKATTSKEKFLIVNAAIKAGFHRIGIYQNFVHLDDDDSLPDHVIRRGNY